MVPLYLGIRFVIAKSFARIHRSNLINSGIIPLVFENPDDYDELKLGQKLVIENAKEQIDSAVIIVKNIDTGKEIKTVGNFTQLEISMLKAGGKINMIKGQEK